MYFCGRFQTKLTGCSKRWTRRDYIRFTPGLGFMYGRHFALFNREHVGRWVRRDNIAWAEFPLSVGEGLIGSSALHESVIQLPEETIVVDSLHSLISDFHDNKIALPNVNSVCLQKLHTLETCDGSLIKSVKTPSTAISTLLNFSTLLTYQDYHHVNLR